MTKISFYSFWGMLFLLISACSTPEMMLDNRMQDNSTLYEVQGRNGWLVNQKLSFGDFKTTKVHRTWTKGYDFPFIIRFTGAKEKLSYTLQDGQGHESEIFCLGKLREQDLQLFHKYFDLNLKAKDAFTGSVILDETRSYDFYVSNLNQNNWFKEAEGHILGENLNIRIRPVKTLSNGKKSLDTRVPGFEFVRDGKLVGAVETLNKGKIWLNNSLDAEQKMVLAAVASALLLRSDLEGHNDLNL